MLTLTYSQFFRIIQNRSGLFAYLQLPTSVQIIHKESGLIAFETIDYSFLVYLNSINTSYNFDSSFKVVISDSSALNLRNYITSELADFYSESFSTKATDLDCPGQPYDDWP